MDQILEQIAEYSRLRALPTPTHEERAHRELLERALGAHAPWEGEIPGSMQRAAAFPVRFSMEGGFGDGEIRAMTGGGAIIATKAAMRAGARLVVRFDVGMGTYVFPATVAGVAPGGRRAIAVRFDGPAERSSFDLSWKGVQLWRRPWSPGAARALAS